MVDFIDTSNISAKNESKGLWLGRQLLAAKLEGRVVDVVTSKGRWRVYPDGRSVRIDNPNRKKPWYGRN